VANSNNSFGLMTLLDSSADTSRVSDSGASASTTGNAMQARLAHAHALHADDGDDVDRLGSGCRDAAAT
jgi:hypothetical protein